MSEDFWIDLVARAVIAVFVFGGVVSVAFAFCCNPWDGDNPL